MPLQLSAEQARVMGCLMEKAVTTPDQYPLTLNALVNACNQKSSRDPVMNLEQGQVQRAINQLKEMHLVVEDENFRSRVQKFSQRLCGTPMSEFAFDSAQYAAICLLLLRGAQTPGEVRSRSGRLHDFADNEEARATLQSLIDREAGSVVSRLSKRVGRQDHEYVHRFNDDPSAGGADGADAAVVQDEVAVEYEAAAASTRTQQPAQSLNTNQNAAGPATPSAWQVAAELRIAELERRVVSLEAQLDSLRQQLGG